MFWNASAKYYLINISNYRKRKFKKNIFFHGLAIFGNLPEKMPKFQNLCKMFPVDTKIVFSLN